MNEVLYNNLDDDSYTYSFFLFLAGLSLRLDIQTEAIHVFASKKVLVLSRCVSETASIKKVSLLEP